MNEKKFVKPSVIHNWVVVIYETEAKFTRFAQDVLQGFIDGCKRVSTFELRTRLSDGKVGTEK